MLKTNHRTTAFLVRLATIISLSLTAPVTTHAEEGKKIVRISSDKVIAIAFIDSKHESRDVFFNTYFPKVLPAIEDAGGRVLAKFETVDVEEGDLTPQYVLLLQYPSVDAFKKAATDPRAVKHLSIRENAVRDFRIGFFTVPEDVDLILESNVTYEFFAGVPAGPETPQQLQTFFQNVIPTALQYGRADALQLMPVQFDRNGYFRPIAGLATWPTVAHFEQFTNTDVFRKNVEALRDPAFASLELINTYFVE